MPRYEITIKRRHGLLWWIAVLFIGFACYGMYLAMVDPSRRSPTAATQPMGGETSTE